MQVLEDSKQLDNFKLWPCGCGCGELVWNFDNQGIPRRYRKGHSNRKGGIKKPDSGYVLIACKGHPRANSQGYVREHILVFEKTYNCCILKWGVVHHRDRNRSNNSWYNLQGMMRWQHTSLHHKGRKQSEEWVRKRVLACEGYKHSEASKLKMRGRKLSEATKQKLSLMNMGKHHSEETKLKMSQAKKIAMFSNRIKRTATTATDIT